MIQNFHFLLKKIFKISFYPNHKRAHRFLHLDFIQNEIKLTAPVHGQKLKISLIKEIYAYPIKKGNRIAILDKKKEYFYAINSYIETTNFHHLQMNL